MGTGEPGLEAGQRCRPWLIPGTVLDDTSLEAGRSNFRAAAWLGEDKAGFAACDISTGQTHATARL